MRGKNLRELFKKNATKTGAVLLATALVLGSSMWTSNQSGGVPELTTFVDNPESVEIDADETPLSNVKVKTSTKTTKTTKKIKLKKKATKTYSKKSATKKKTTTSKKQTRTETTTTKTVVASSMTSSFKKGSNINTQVTTTKTTVTTTIVGNSSMAVTTASAGATVPNGVIELSKAAPKLNSNIANAFDSLNFKVKIDSGVTYSGLFDARTQSITLRRLDDTVYHEMGHFVAFAAGNMDKSAAFQQVYAQEKSQYTAFNKAYVLSNSSEYFAESFKNYTLNPSELRVSRPQTYEAMEKAVAAVTPEQVAKMKMFYGAVWS